MNTTQEHLNLSDINQDLIICKDGSFALILQTSAVNFGLLSELEQVAIIDSFAQMLNSLSFSIQILIHSTRLDISSYIRLLDKAQYVQTNSLLQELMNDYKNFVKSTIKEQEVLDKRFYLILSLSPQELGINIKKEDKLKKAKIMLAPRRDQIIRSLNRVGLKAFQLNTYQLLKLFYEIYNPPTQEKAVQVSPVKLSNPQVVKIMEPIPTQVTSLPTLLNPPVQTPTPLRHHPFIVEELSDTL